MRELIAEAICGAAFGRLFVIQNQQIKERGCHMGKRTIVSVLLVAFLVLLVNSTATASPAAGEITLQVELSHPNANQLGLRLENNLGSNIDAFGRVGYVRSTRVFVGEIGAKLTLATWDRITGGVLVNVTGRLVGRDLMGSGGIGPFVLMSAEPLQIQLDGVYHWEGNWWALGAEARWYVLDGVFVGTRWVEDWIEGLRLVRGMFGVGIRF